MQTFKCLGQNLSNLFELNKYRGVSFMTLESHAKFEEKLTCGLDNDMRKSN